MSRPCGNPECGRSTGIHEGITCGTGELDPNGFWEFPCDICEAWWSAYEAGYATGLAAGRLAEREAVVGAIDDAIADMDGERAVDTKGIWYRAALIDTKASIESGSHLQPTPGEEEPR